MKVVCASLLCVTFVVGCAPVQRSGSVEAPLPPEQLELRALIRAALEAVVGESICDATAPCAVLKIHPAVVRSRTFVLPDSTMTVIGRLEWEDVAMLPATRVVLGPFDRPSLSSDTTWLWLAWPDKVGPLRATDRMLDVYVVSDHEPYGLMLRLTLRRLFSGWGVVDSRSYQS